jgi:sirohydrochlorin cobaltochelatase
MIAFPPKPDSALLILGHGSTENADSSSSVRSYAETLRQRSLFAEVHCAFWKEEPHFDRILAKIDSHNVYIVPAFISEGYFTHQIIPQALGLAGRTTTTENHTLHYCDPVGSHPSMTRRLLERATELAAGIDRSEVALIIVGHGTPRDSRSSTAVKLQVEKLGEQQPGFAEITDAYLSEAPLIGDWDQLLKAPHVVVLPFFIAEGLHSREDIPEALGFDPASGNGPHQLRDRTLYYSNAIGADADIADVVLEQVIAFDASS